MLSCQISIAPSINLCIPSMPVTNFSNLMPLIEAMYSIMIEHDGIGIAAPQVGYNLMVIVLGAGNFSNQMKEKFLVHNFLCVINPTIKKLDVKKISVKEGCLSLPGAELSSVSRANRIELQAQNINSDTYNLTIEGLESIILQHETDHLHGLLYPSRATDGARIIEKYGRTHRISFAELDRFSRIMKQNLESKYSQSEEDFIHNNCSKGIEESVVRSIWNRIIEING